MNCDFCGKEITSRTRGEIHHYCSQKCRRLAMAEYNRNCNPMNMPGGIEESRVKRGAMQRDRGAGKTYRKYLGRHEHRVVAERIIGRALLPGEVVHHIDGNKRNNSPENLLVLTSQAEHAHIHAKGGDATCRKKT